MAIGNHNDLTHIVRTSDQWKNTYDKYELIPTGVLCVELVSSDVTKIKIGDGHNIFSKLPYIGDLDLSKYYTKLETDTRIKEILTQEKVVRIKGIVGSKSDLPADARCGNIYFVRQLSSSDNKYIEYIYSPDNTWEPLGGIPVDIDLSEYAKTAYVDDKIEQVNERIDDIEQHGTHTHPNKEILDQITEPYTTADKETLASLHNYDDTEIREMISQSSHTHDNKDILDATSAAFTKEDKSKLDQLNPYDDSVLKEKITALERLAHEHSNKRILDQTTASFTKEYERKMRWIRIYTGCTGMEEGIAGLVPAAQAGEEDYVLSGSGEWVPQTGGGGTYTLPIATANTLGGIKVGDGLEIDENGVLSATGGGGGGDSIDEGDGITITTDPQTGVKTISVDTGNGLQINQDGEVEIDPSIIPEVPNLIPGKAIEFEHESNHLQLTDFSNNDFVASVTSMNNGSFSRPADNSSITITSSTYDCYTKGIGGDGGSSGSYAYTVKPNTQYRLMWDSSDTTISGTTIIFENAGYDRMHSIDQATASYIDFTTGPNCSFFSTRFGIANPNQTITFSNIRLYEYVEDTFESDKINVRYNKGLNINRDNELEVVLSDGLQFDLTASETMVADETYLFNSRVTCQVHTDSPYSGRPTDRIHQKTNDETALCCLWEVGDGGILWTGPLIVGLTETSVQYTTQDTSQTVNYQNTFTYLGKTWYTSGYPDFLNDADHEDKLGHLQYLGSYAAVADQIQAAKDLIDIANTRFVSNAGIQAKLGNGLSFDNNGAIEAPVMGASGANHSSGLVPDPGSTAGTTKFLREDGTWAEPESGDSYEAGNGIEITEVTHEDEFRVQNQEYFFTDHGLTCIITGNYGPRTYTKINDGDIVAAVMGTTNGWYMPLFVGLTEDSVKYSNSYDSNILGPTGSFTYHDKIWYYTADYALTAGDGVDHAGHLQSLSTTYAAGNEGQIQAAKDLIDLAVLLPDVSSTTISAKIGAGLSFDANGAIQADAQPLSPATYSTLGGVIVGEGINVDEYGEISLSTGEGLDIDFVSPLPSEYTLVKGISSTANGNQYINTGYKIKPTTVIKMTCAIYKRNASMWSIPLGTRDTSNAAHGGLLFVTCWDNSFHDIPSLWIEDTSGTASSSDANLFYNDIIELTFTNNNVTCYNTRTEDTIVLTASSSVSQPVSYDLYVFATNDVGTAHFFGIMDLYSLQIFEGSAKLYDYIPCQRNSDNKYGLYDIINDEFKLSPNNASFSYVQGTPTALDLIQQIKLLPATENTIGGVKPGDGILVDNDGTISVDPTIIPEVIEYEAGTAISIEDVEHGGVTFDAWNNGTGWENVCYADSTGNSVINYQYEAHSPISNSYTLPTGATHIRAIAYDQNDTMLWTSFSWIDANDYHFASTSPDVFDDWFEIPTGAVKVNFGVRHSKLDTTTAMNLNDIKSVDITVQTVSEAEVDVWNGGTGWLNGDYGSGTSNDFYTNWYYTYHYNYQQYIEVPEGATHVMVQGISNENDSHFEGGGCNVFDSNHNHIYWWACAWEWHEISSDVKYVQPNVKWDNANSRTISGSDVKSVTLVWKFPTLETNQAINVKYGDGLTVNQNNELEVNLGSGLQFDANGAIEVTSGGGDTIAEGDGISITDDQQTGDKIISVNYGDGLTIDPITGALTVDGQLPEGTILKKLTYTGNGSTSANNIQFEKKPLAILSIYGSAGTNYIASNPAPIDAPYLMGDYGGVNNNDTCNCAMSYNDATNVLTLSPGYGSSGDEGFLYNVNGRSYTVWYLVKGHTEGGTSATNEVSVIKSFSYVGTGTIINNIQFPETPDYILNISGPLGSIGDIITDPIDIQHPTTTSTYIFHWTQNGSGLTGRGLYSFNDSTNVLTLDGQDYGATLNYANNVYYVRYVVNEIIASDSGDTVAEGNGISITTDAQTGDKVIAVNAGSGLSFDQTTHALEVSSGVVTSIAPTQNTPGSITVTEGDGTATPVQVLSQMGGATSSTAGTAGYVPAPSSGDNESYLRGDGTWDDDVVTENDLLTLVFVPDDYTPPTP